MKYQIWYMKRDFFRAGLMGATYLDAHKLLPKSKELEKTHTHLKDLEAEDPEHVFEEMQGEVWSPNGEARELIKSKNLGHTSMSVGDVMIDHEWVWLVDLIGFVLLGKRIDHE